MFFCYLIFNFMYYFSAVDVSVEEEDDEGGDESEDDRVAAKEVGGLAEEISDCDECE